MNAYALVPYPLTAMSTVQILPENVISKIAAGEVIERPASVIKELVENALDAGADTITVHLKDAGKTLIKVKDNGCGIAPDDLERIFTRHATSKIKGIDDLTAIHSLGFRGEALYSIGAIADVTLRSKGRTMCAPTCPGPDAAAGTGWEIRLRGTERLGLRPCNLTSTGTEIEIRELFYNTPARRKFLKNNATEIHQILNIFLPYALLHNDIRFKLTHEERDLINLAPAENAVSRIAHALNLDEKHLLTVGTGFKPVPTPDMPLSIHLVMGDINIKRARRDMQFIFVNNRPVQNKSISFHLNQIYRLIMPEGSHPFFAVFLEIPPEDLDVNIHPTKREVKIRDEQAVCSALRRLCEETLRQSGRIKQVTGYRGQGTRQDAGAHLPARQVMEQAWEQAHFPEVAFDASHDAYPSNSALREAQESFIPQMGTGRDLSLQNRLRQARYVGSFIDKYLLFQIEDSLLVMDQHAAAERIAYERLIAQIQKGHVEVQRLLSPVLIKCSPQEILIWEEMQDRLREMGLDTNAWDKETVAIHSHPLFLKDIEKGLRYLLAGEDIGRGDHDALARRACRSSVMAGDVLDGKKTEALRDQLVKCLDPLTCPHGRPTVIEVSRNFLDKQFLRT
jgi:DNA mismatch repair protein MutL